MLTADQRKELEALEAEIRECAEQAMKRSMRLVRRADRIAAVLANGDSHGNV